MRARETTLDSFVQGARKLYSLPAVAVEVLSLADDPKADSSRLKTCIERDPALTARLLRVVNSSMFGLVRPVADLNQAIAMLGANALKLLVLGFSLPEQLFAAKASDVLRLYWRRALTRAVAARDLAAAVGDRHGDEAFIAGLLGDLGILVLVQEGEDRYLRLFLRAQDEGTSLVDAERRVYGFNHIELTVKILREWKLPASIVEAVSCGLAESPAENSELESRPSGAQILHCANLLAELLVEERTDLWPELLDIAEEQWRFGADRLAELSESLQEKVDHLAKALNLELADGRCYRDTLERARQKIIVASEAVADELLHLRRNDANEPSAELLNDAESLHREVENAHRDAALLTSAHQTLRNETARMATLLSAKSSTVAKEPAAPTSPPKIDELDAALRQAVVECRQSRAPLSLVFVELDRFSESVEEFGMLWGEYASRTLADVCAAIDWPRLRVVGEGADRRALILANADRYQASRIVGEIVRRYRALCPLDEVGSTTLSTGAATVAMPARNFPSEELLAAARRCLYAAKVAAGDNSKSIEIS
ncbi:MAG: HDOD domain-containing protein [Planctomycetia bacterium]|nr:HDOD domain-containing protein [Planctomycetia bacterium]